MIGVPQLNSKPQNGAYKQATFGTYPGRVRPPPPRGPPPPHVKPLPALRTGDIDDDGDVVPPPPCVPNATPPVPDPESPEPSTRRRHQGVTGGFDEDGELIPPPPSYPKVNLNNMPYKTKGGPRSPPRSARGTQGPGHKKARSQSLDNFELSVSRSKFRGYHADNEHSMSSSSGGSATSVEMSRATSLSDMSSIIGTTPTASLASVSWSSEAKLNVDNSLEARKSFITFDKYGFPSKTEELDPLIRREIIRRNNVRLDKWRDMIYSDSKSKKLTGVSALPEQVKHWNKVKKHKKLKSRVRKGVPDPLRRDIWQNMCGSRELMIAKPRFYRQLLNSGEPSPEEEQIHKDLNRTYRDHKDFQDADGALMTSLFNVLRVYSLYDKKLGYCQGMSGVTALMLMYMGEEEAFWVLVALAEDKRYELKHCWSEGMPLVHQKFYQFTRLLKHFMPKLYRHFQREEVTNPSMYGGTAWFVDIFLSNQPPFEMVVRIWDVFLHEGQKFVFRIALAVFQKHEKELLKLEFPDILMRMNEAFRTLDADELIPLAINIKLTHRMLDKLGKQYKKLPKDKMPF